LVGLDCRRILIVPAGENAMVQVVEVEVAKDGMTGGTALPEQAPTFARAKKFHFREPGGCGTVAAAGQLSSASGAAAELS
jgi:hypothetical protein